MYIEKVRQRKAHMRAYMRRGRRSAVAHVKVTWHATAANQYRGTMGCVRSRGGSERRRSRGSQCVRGRQPHLVEESSLRETRAHPRTHIYTYTHTYTHTHAHTHTPLGKHPVAVVRPVVSLSTRSACCGTADSSKEGSSRVQDG